MKLNQPLTRSAILVLACTTAASAIASGQSDASEPMLQPSKLFLQLDTNHDGYVSRHEASAMRGYEAGFAASDTNKDGKLSPDEFIKEESVHERQQMAGYAHDSVITAKVKAALIKDLELKALDVSVETYRGRVLLSGFVDNSKQARHAVQIAAAINGVTRVENALQVK